MEPIRPDDDELRATRDSNTEKPKAKTRGSKERKPPAKGRNGGSGGNSGGGKKSSGPLFLVALLAVAGAGAVGWYQQDQRIAEMESQLEEADYWARQSKLALARFEGELSETGDDLQQAGQSIEERLSQQGERLDTADSEIRKLWGVTNDRNRKRLDDHEARLESLDGTVEEVAASTETLTASLDELEQAVESQVSELESSLQQEIAAQGERIEGQESALEEVQASVDEQVESRIKRFEREQSLTIDGLEGRISSLERATDALSGEKIESISSELDTLKQTVESIDSSRAQLTSRLVRLSEEVSQLRSQTSGQ